MALITFSGGATLRVPGSAQQVVSALKGARDGREFAKFSPGTYLNPYQIAFVTDEDRKAADGEPSGSEE